LKYDANPFVKAQGDRDRVLNDDRLEKIQWIGRGSGQMEADHDYKV
jgi:hypothetical protein